MDKVLKNNIYQFLKFIPDRMYLKIMYYIFVNKKLNLKNPTTFNEKMQWLKLYNRKDIYTKLVDKIEVRKYIVDKIGEKYLIPLYGEWDSYDDIDFKSLPNEFVLKCNHDSGSVYICHNKFEIDHDMLRKKYKKFLKHNMFWNGREWPYKNVKPKILAEKLMNENNDTNIKDYKLMVFNGKVKCSFVVSDRFSKEGMKVTFFDRRWNKMSFERQYPSSDKKILKPKYYSEMISLAEKIGKDFPFVRVDFYEINDKIYFGELTFFPGSGFEKFRPYEWDITLGDWIDISEV